VKVAILGAGDGEFVIGWLAGARGIVGKCGGKVGGAMFRVRHRAREQQISVATQ
jgi:hypothetical protein